MSFEGNGTLPVILTHKYSSTIFASDEVGRPNLLGSSANVRPLSLHSSPSSFIAFEGARLGADEFVSFDKQAVSILKAQGKRARLLS